MQGAVSRFVATSQDFAWRRELSRLGTKVRSGAPSIAGKSDLRHELIHVLFAELFPNALPPRWAEEGFALLNDSDDKQARHLNDLRQAVETKTTIPLNRLLATADYPTGWQRAVYYGHSMSVVETLTQLNTPDQFLRFVQLSLDTDHERALRTVYKIDSLDDLERGWREYALAAIPK